MAVFTIFNEGKGKMDILQTTEYKNIELISFDFEACVDEEIRQQITFRYGSLKSKLAHNSIKAKSLVEKARSFRETM